MKTAAFDEGDVYADYDYILVGDNNATAGFIVNFTKMEEICPHMTDDDRALLKGQPSRTPSPGATRAYTNFPRHDAKVL